MDGLYELSVSEKSRIEDGFCAEYRLVQKHEAAGNHLLVEARTGRAMPTTTFTNARVILAPGISPPPPNHASGKAKPTSFGLYAMSLQMIDRRIFYDHSGKDARKRCT